MEALLDPADEVKRLQRCVADLTRLFALPGVRGGSAPARALGTLLDTLLGMLRVDFVYARVKHPGADTSIEVARGDRGLAPVGQRQICEALGRWLDDAGAPWRDRDRLRIATTDLSIAPVGAGPDGNAVVIVAGSQRSNFPADTDRLLLRAAADRAWIGLREIRLPSGAHRLADERDRRIGQRARSVEDRTWTQTLLTGEKRLLEMIASGCPLADVLGALCTFVEAAAPGAHCSVHTIDWNGPTFGNVVAPSLPAGYAAAIEGLPVHGGVAPCGEAVYLKRQLIARDIASDPRWERSGYRAHVLALGLRSAWSTPIYSRYESVLGTLCIYPPRRSNPSHREQDLIGQVAHIASIAIERAQSEAAVKRSEAFLAEAQRLSRVGSFSWRVATDEITWSEQLYRIFEINPSVRVRLDLIRTRVHPDDLALFDQVICTARATGADVDYEQRLQMPDQSVKYLHVSARATHDKQGRIEYLGAAQDVTQRRLSEEALADARAELARMSRITTLGALTASIAHEVNQPLAGIMTNANTCMRMLSAHPPNVDGALETVRRTLRDANRATDVIARLRALFMKKEATIDAIDLNEAAREVVAVSMSDLQRNRVVVRAELTDGLPPVTGDRVQLQQVILNLLRNASEAMAAVDDRARELTISTDVDGNGRVRLTVRDAGVGLIPDAADRLFQAFYTTKAGGMGVGLAISRSIIESHQGRLWAEANPGPGTTFSFSIPCSGGGATSAVTLGALRNLPAIDAAHMRPT